MSTLEPKSLSEWRKRRTEARMEALPTATCEICGAPFKLTRTNRKTCGAKECSMALSRTHKATHRERESAEPLGHFSVCEICGTLYKSSYGQTRTCGSEDCQRLRSLARRKERLAQNGAISTIDAVRRCSICAAEFKPHRPHQVTCGGRECQKTHNRRAAQAYRDSLKRGTATTDAEDRLLYQFTGSPKPQRKRKRICLKCDRPFYSDVNRICHACHESNEDIYLWGG
jgi:hypothetical protein